MVHLFAFAKRSPTSGPKALFPSDPIRALGPTQSPLADKGKLSMKPVPPAGAAEFAGRG
jgi:hypothetical protein